MRLYAVVYIEYESDGQGYLDDRRDMQGIFQSMAQAKICQAQIWEKIKAESGDPFVRRPEDATISDEIEHYNDTSDAELIILTLDTEDY